ncbi:MAG: hypothetical protein ACRDVW_02690, partial [Acidimicrobiales bacterium]
MEIHLVAALNSSTKMIEVVVLAVVIILLATILVLYRRNSRPAKASVASGQPSTAASYYSDVSTLPSGGGFGGGQALGGQSDPFAGFGGGMSAPAPSA